MHPKNRAVLEGAILVARETGADAVLLAAALPEEAHRLREALGGERRVITAAPGNGGGRPVQDGEIVALPEVRLRRRGRAKVALLEGLAAGLLRPGERVIIISGNAVDGACELDTVAVVELTHDEELLDGQADAPLAALRLGGDAAVFDALLSLCVELGHEGKEGKRVGVLMTFGDHDTVLARSHALVLNPFAGHSEEERSVLSPSTRRAVREFSGMDGAFVVTADGIIVAAGRYLQDVASERAVPPGLGARHRAAAGITSATQCVALVVSESTGDTRVFGDGRLLMTIERTD